jgi:hypothetical protein
MSLRKPLKNQRRAGHKSNSDIETVADEQEQDGSTEMRNRNGIIPIADHTRNSITQDEQVHIYDLNIRQDILE